MYRISGNNVVFDSGADELFLCDLSVYVKWLRSELKERNDLYCFDFDIWFDLFGYDAHCNSMLDEFGNQLRESNKTINKIISAKSVV